MSIILDALRKAEEEKKLRQSPPEMDIKKQILTRDRRTKQDSSSPVNRAVLVGFVVAIAGLAVLGLYSSLTALRSEKPVQLTSNTRVAAPSRPVEKTEPAAEGARVAAPPAAKSPTIPSVVAAPPSPAPSVVPTPSSTPEAKTAPAPSVMAAASPPSENAHKGKRVKAVRNSKIAGKTSSNAVFGPPDADAHHQVISNQGAAFTLEGIIFHADPDKRIAIMRVGAEGNEATVRIGDTVGTWLVGDIQLDRVTFSDHAKTIVLKLD